MWFSARSTLHCPSKRSQKQIADAFKQKIVFPHARNASVVLLEDCRDSLCFQSQRFIRPTTMATWPADPSEPLFLFLSPILPRLLKFGPISSQAVLAEKSFSGSRCTASAVVNSRLELGLCTGLCVKAATRFSIQRSSCTEIDLCLRRGGGQRRQPAVCVI